VRQLIVDACAALAIGVVLFTLSTILTAASGGYLGWPLEFGSQLTTCGIPRPSSGCAFVYNTTLTIEDYAIWAFIGFAIVLSLRYRYLKVRETQAPSDPVSVQ
jgi:hypothetical protein